MAGRVEGKVAFITGAARGQGRAHAVRLAEEGADIIAVDVCEDIPTYIAEPSTEEDLSETVRQVEALDRRIVATKADVRDYQALKKAVDDGVAQLGRLDIVSANAGIYRIGPLTHEISEEDWQAIIDVNLTGVWHTAKAVIPHLIEGGRGGSMILTSSLNGLKGGAGYAHYVSTKHAVVGLMRTLALELGEHNIRVNTVNPGVVHTAMVHNDVVYGAFRPDLDNPGRADFEETAAELAVLPTTGSEPRDIANALLFLASDEARYITGITLPVDAGWLLK